MSFDPQQIKNQIGQEINNAIVARFKKNNGRINLSEVINEAGICLATNYFILLNKPPVPVSADSFISTLKDGIFLKIEEFFPDTFSLEQKRLVGDRFEELTQYPNLKDIINIHYNNLYGSNGRNVL